MPLSITANHLQTVRVQAKADESSDQNWVAHSSLRTAAQIQFCTDSTVHLHK